jgi:hypothetical protein
LDYKNTFYNFDKATAEIDQAKRVIENAKDELKSMTGI